MTSSSVCSVLRSEAALYTQDLNRVKLVLRDTCDLFDEIEAATQLSGFKLSGDTFTEETDLRAYIDAPPSIVIIGNCQNAKSQLVNKIFSEELYPSVENEDVQTIRNVRFRYGRLQTVGLTLPDQYELVDNLVAYDRPWKTLPIEDIRVPNDDYQGSHAVLDVQLNNALMKEGMQVLVKGTDSLDINLFVESIQNSVNDVSPIYLYAITGDTLSAKELANLSEMNEKSIGSPMLFVRMDSKPATETQTNGLTRLALYEQLAKLGLVSMMPADNRVAGYVNGEQLSCNVESDIVDDMSQFTGKLCSFISACLRNNLISMTSVLQLVHKRSLNDFILQAFDMQRDMMITPKRLEFARTKEQELSETLMKLALEKQEEIRKLVGEAIDSTRSNIIHTVSSYEFIGVDFDENNQVSSSRDLRICNGQIRELVVGKLNHEIAGKLVQSVNVLRECYIGTLTRCIESLESHDIGGLNTMSKENRNATNALRQILNAAYQVNVSINPGSHFLKSFVEKMKQLVQSLPWHAQPKIDKSWKEKVANDMLNNLSESRLARSVGEQFRNRLKQSHDHFSSALKQLDTHHTGRLEKAEDRRQKLRKIHAPKIAKLTLESSSLRDLIMYGMPICGREIGRGQYGVVYACDEWAGVKPCAIKSVVPPDDRHMNDLALEFYYTKNVPEHERLVSLKGSVIDYTYGGGMTPAVLIVMNRMAKDFYTAIKQGMDWLQRLVVTIDVVEGIRFLHSQGLVHRDIKLKNVLLTRDDNRGKITDLGFCKPEAMMSGSIVGTPIHMAPELFSGLYDNSVDVYAFGVLFWYVCSGSVRLPQNFEQCSSKDQLFNSVKKGLRPEKLETFDDDCWNLMNECWDSLPLRRPLTGTVDEKLRALYDFYKATPDICAAKNTHKYSKPQSGGNTSRRSARK